MERCYGKAAEATQRAEWHTVPRSLERERRSGTARLSMAAGFGPITTSEFEPADVTGSDK